MNHITFKAAIAALAVLATTDPAANAFKFIDANNMITVYSDSDDIGPIKFKGYEAWYCIPVENYCDRNMKIE